MNNDGRSWATRMENRHCLSRTHLPAHLYTVREKYLKRFRTLARMLPGIPVKPGTEFEGLVNMGAGRPDRPIGRVGAVLNGQFIRLAGAVVGDGHSDAAQAAKSVLERMRGVAESALGAA